MVFTGEFPENEHSAMYDGHPLSDRIFASYEKAVYYMEWSSICAERLAYSDAYRYCVLSERLLEQAGKLAIREFAGDVNMAQKEHDHVFVLLPIMKRKKGHLERLIASCNWDCPDLTKSPGYRSLD